MICPNSKCPASSETMLKDRFEILEKNILLIFEISENNRHFITAFESKLKELGYKLDEYAHDCDKNFKDIWARLSKIEENKTIVNPVGKVKIEYCENKICKRCNNEKYYFVQPPYKDYHQVGRFRVDCECAPPLYGVWK